MPTDITRAGLMLGVIGLLYASSVRADDLRSTQALIESGLFLSQVEADAVYARLDAPRPASDKPTPGTAAYWESGALGLAQAERAGRLGWGADATQMRLGADQEVRTGLIVGASAGASIGSVASADLSAQTVSRHVDVYGRLDSGSFFAKALVGGSTFEFEDMARASAHGQAQGYALRTGGQVGGSINLAGVTFTPTVALTATGHALGGYRESGTDAADFGAREAAAATSTVRLGGTKRLKLDPRHAVDVSGFVGADEIVAFKASALKASGAGTIGDATVGQGAAPTGRGLFGGMGLSTSLADGVSLKLDYDYGLRDGVSTRTGRARVGVTF